jgi:RND family efflux transporter MFP subunit
MNGGDAGKPRYNAWTALYEDAPRRVLQCALAVALVATASVGAHAQSTPSASQKEFDCVIEPQQTVKLASPVVGVIARLDVDRGDIVHKGQVLGKLEDGVEEAALAIARLKALNEHSIKALQARVDFLRRKSGRADALVGKSIVSQASADEAEADAKSSEQQLKEAELNFELNKLDADRAAEVVNQRLLKSPIDGVVVERLLLPGEYRNEQSPILTLAQLDPLRVEVFVPTIYYGQINQGTPAIVRPEMPIGGEHSATVTVVDRVMDAASGTFGIRLALPNPDMTLPGGIRCKVQFNVATAQKDR